MVHSSREDPPAHPSDGAITDPSCAQVCPGCGDRMLDQPAGPPNSRRVPWHRACQVLCWVLVNGLLEL